MITFEVGKVYHEHFRSVSNPDNIIRYLCTRRTDKTVWIAYLDDDGTQDPEERHRVHYYGDVCEYLYDSSSSKSNWAISSFNLFAKDVEE